MGYDRAIELKTFEPIHAESEGHHARSGDQLEFLGQAILSLLHTAAGEAETVSRQALEKAQRLSRQLQAAQDRIAELEAEVRLFREKAERAEGWLSKISTEIEDRLINASEEKQRLH